MRKHELGGKQTNPHSFGVDRAIFPLGDGSRTPKLVIIVGMNSSAQNQEIHSESSSPCRKTLKYIKSADLEHFLKIRKKF